MSEFDVYQLMSTHNKEDVLAVFRIQLEDLKTLFDRCNVASKDARIKNFMAFPLFIEQEVNTYMFISALELGDLVTATIYCRKMYEMNGLMKFFSVKKYANDHLQLLIIYQNRDADITTLSTSLGISIRTKKKMTSAQKFYALNKALIKKGRYRGAIGEQLNWAAHSDMNNSLIRSFRENGKPYFSPYLPPNRPGNYTRLTTNYRFRWVIRIGKILIEDYLRIAEKVVDNAVINRDLV